MLKKMTSLLFSSIMCLSMTIQPLSAKELALVTNQNTLNGGLDVSIVNHKNYSYDSIDLYSESEGKSSLIGNYLKNETSNLKVPLNSTSKQLSIRGVVNNPLIVNDGAELYIKANIPYYIMEGTPVEFNYLFNGLGDCKGYKWIISSYKEDNSLIGVNTYENLKPPTIFTA